MKLRDEDGQVLLLALGFLMFFGLVIGALMTLTGASVLASERLREQRSTVYAADGAMDAAIQAGRGDRALGGFGVAPCMHTTAFTVTATTADATTATVTCESLAAPISLDRTVKFTASVGGAPVVVATVVYRDGAAGASGVSAAVVQDWTYCGHDLGVC